MAMFPIALVEAMDCTQARNFVRSCDERVEQFPIDGLDGLHAAKKRIAAKGRNVR